LTGIEVGFTCEKAQERKEYIILHLGSGEFWDSRRGLNAQNADSRGQFQYCLRGAGGVYHFVWAGVVFV
jgi:hypothetical protein